MLELGRTKFRYRHIITVIDIVSLQAKNWRLALVMTETSPPLPPVCMLWDASVLQSSIFLKEYFNNFFFDFLVVSRTTLNFKLPCVTKKEME
mgnify:CR=1 FL=1